MMGLHLTGNMKLRGVAISWGPLVSFPDPPYDTRTRERD